jgi:hypothetical protein
VTYEGIWVSEKNRHVIERVKPGDLVFIYETRSGPIVLRAYIDGTIKKAPCRQGRGGVVALVRATQYAQQPEDSQPERYADGSRIWWRYYATTESINSAGFIPQRQFAMLLGHPPNYHFRGYGEKNSGLREIPSALFDNILVLFLASAERADMQYSLQASGRGWSEGGEGVEHLELKEAIAEDPSKFLRETGLTLWAKEWLLPTSDRVDLILKDRYGRFVAVEVEVDCSETELAGPLQCMKYRAMLSYFFDRPLDEVRCILAARSLHGSVIAKCTQHRVESVIIERTGKNGDAQPAARA